MIRQLFAKCSLIFRKVRVVKTFKNVYEFLEERTMHPDKIRLDDKLTCVILLQTGEGISVDVDKDSGLISCWISNIQKDTSLYTRLMTMEQFEEFFNTRVIPFDVMYNGTTLFKRSKELRRKNDFRNDVQQTQNDSPSN